MNTIDNLQRTILKCLAVSSGKLDEYTLFKRSRVGFADFSKAYRKLKDKKIIREVDNFVFITADGAGEAKKILSLLQSKEKPWRQIPKEYIGEIISGNSQYVPSIKLLDKTTFKF